MAGSESYPALSVRNEKEGSTDKAYFPSTNTICVNGNNLVSTFLIDEFAKCSGVSCSVGIVTGILARLIERNKSQKTKYNPKLLINQIMQSIIEG